MNISNVKELSKLMDLCRKKGIETIEVDNVKIVFGKSIPKKQGSQQELMPQPDFTPDNILNWSADGVG